MSWLDRAKCASEPLEDTKWLREASAAGRWDSVHHAKAKLICQGCPVRRECLAAAMEFEKGMPLRSRHGIWGATVPDERARLSKRLSTAVSA